LKHNAFSDLIPLAIAFKAMGLESDIELMTSVGPEAEFHARLLPTVEESLKLGIVTQAQALRYMGTRTKSRRAFPTAKSRSASEEAGEVLATTVSIKHKLSPFTQKLFSLSYPSFLMLSRIL